LFGSAEQEIDILDDCEFPAKGCGILRVLADRALAGVRVRICVTDPADVDQVGPTAGGMFPLLRDTGDMAVRLHRIALYNCIYRSDGELMVAERADGVPAERAPVRSLLRAKGDGIAGAYIQSFDKIWADARETQ